MSSMIQCDRCKRSFYTDSRSLKGAYCKLKIEYGDYSAYHLCYKCHKDLLIDFLHSYDNDAEYYEQYGKVEE